MVTKQQLKDKFKTGAKPTQRDFEDLIDLSINEDFYKSVEKVSSYRDVGFSGASVTSVLSDDKIEFDSNSTYTQIGFIVPSNAGKKFIVSYKIKNIGTINITRFGWRIGYNNSGSNFATQDPENIFTGVTLPINGEHKGVFSFAQTNTRPRAIPAIFLTGNGGKFELEMKVYDVTGVSDELLENINYDNISNFKISHVDFASLADIVKYHNSNWRGTEWMSLGDSITATGAIQAYVKNQLGFGTINNKGIPGATVTRFLENVSDAEIQRADLITLYGCFNNFSVGNSPLGSLSDAASSDNNGTFTSKFKYVLEYIMNKKKNAMFLVIGTHNGSGGVLPPTLGGFFNGTSTVYDGVKRMEEVCKMYGIPFLNMYEKSMINAITQSTATTDGLHLTDEWNKKVATIIAGELQKYQPLS